MSIVPHKTLFFILFTFVMTPSFGQFTLQCNGGIRTTQKACSACSVGRPTRLMSTCNQPLDSWGNACGSIICEPCTCEGNQPNTPQPTGQGPTPTPDPTPGQPGPTTTGQGGCTLGIPGCFVYRPATASAIKECISVVHLSTSGNSAHTTLKASVRNTCSRCFSISLQTTLKDPRESREPIHLGNKTVYPNMTASFSGSGRPSLPSDISQYDYEVTDPKECFDRQPNSR
jgi:hypothetical protein